jgi:hypothetical protein
MHKELSAMQKYVTGATLAVAVLGAVAFTFRR